MKQVHIKILMSIQKYLEENPDIRFGQALWNLGIINWAFNEFKESAFIEDPHKKTDEEILNSIKNATSKKNK
jgi:hypothetical protein